MKPGTIIFQGKSKSGKDLVFRYPANEDLQMLRDYINTLSKEKTFIIFQGEQVSLKEEKIYLDSQLKTIAKGKAVQLLAFSEGKLAGNTQINLKDKATKHIGVFGISLAKEFRSEGIGFLLMEKIIEEAKQNLKGLKIITLELFGNNEIAGKLYKKMGFIEFGNLPKGIIYRDTPVNHIYMFKEV
ncbi:MAG: GNAT family N-acetyltransferase [Candidatus Daviesbacteria bacterium]|nr:GNAT family N-acetyltransferase [Candidatus Daviesbacteria bacterium]